MFRTITTKYPATCCRCHQAIEVGERIRYGGPGRTYHFAADCNRTDDDSRPRKPAWGSQEWAETRGDDIPSLDQPGDDYDNGLADNF